MTKTNQINLMEVLFPGAIQSQLPIAALVSVVRAVSNWFSAASLGAEMCPPSLENHQDTLVLMLVDYTGQGI